MQLTNVYIDGFNLYYGALKDTPYKWLDLDALCRRLLPKHRIGRIRYFTAIVSARPNDPSGPDRQRTYLRAYLLADAFRQDCEAVVVITNDSDLKEPIRVVRSELGLPVGVVNPHDPRKRSRALLDVTFFKQLRPSILGACQLPEVLTDRHGTISKPQRW